MGKGVKVLSGGQETIAPSLSPQLPVYPGQQDHVSWSEELVCVYVRLSPSLRQHQASSSRGWSGIQSLLASALVGRALPIRGACLSGPGWGYLKHPHLCPAFAPARSALIGHSFFVVVLAFNVFIPAFKLGRKIP